MKYKEIILSFFLFTGLLGCESDNIALSEACNELNKMCENLKPDGRCLSLRRNVIISALDLKKDFSQRKQYHHMLILEDYIDCAKEATWITYKDLESEYKRKDFEKNYIPTEEDNINRKNRIEGQQRIKNNRIVSYYYAKEMLGQLSDLSIDNDDEYSLYWHWTRNLNQDAINKLIKLDKKGKINTYDMKYYLAQEYIKRDPDKAMEYMLSSLSMYPKDYYTPRSKKDNSSDYEVLRQKGKIHYSALRSLSTLYFKKKKYKRAYIFAKILEINNEKNVNIEMITPHLEDHYIKFLDKKSNVIHESLENGDFDFS